jgi:orotate phosphoribosyltransferase
MKDKAYKVALEKNPLISMEVIPGHFTTSGTHTTHFLDVSEMKSNSVVARDIARELAVPYSSSVAVDTIVCMENMEVIGAYLAEELALNGVHAVSGGTSIHVITPLRNNLGHLSFQSSNIPNITNKNVLVVTATIAGGTSIDNALDCISYYRGKIVGISALFMAFPERIEHEINYLFTSQDIAGYQVYRSRQCEMCKEGLKIDALISSEGYTKI